MDWNDTAEQAEFRSQVRTFIQERLPEQYRRMDDTSQGHLVPWFRHRRSADERLRQGCEGMGDCAGRTRLGRPALAEGVWRARA